jgi:hypothetical protein
MLSQSEQDMLFRDSNWLLRRVKIVRSCAIQVGVTKSPGNKLASTLLQLLRGYNTQGTEA